MEHVIHFDDNMFSCSFRTDVNLQQRIEYLSRSIMCAKSSSTRTSSAVEGEFLHELEEKMEVELTELYYIYLCSD